MYRIGILVCFLLLFLSLHVPAQTGLGLNKYPLDKELGGECGSIGKDDSRMISLKCKVTREKNLYVYTYKIKNLSKKSNINFNWAVLDRAICSGWTIPHWWDLKPQEEIVITLKHEQAPVNFTGNVSLMNEGHPKKHGWEETLKEQGVTLPDRPFFHVSRFGQPGPLPPAFTKKDE